MRELVSKSMGEIGQRRPLWMLSSRFSSTDSTTRLMISPKHRCSEAPPVYNIFQRHLKVQVSLNRHAVLAAQERWPPGNRLIE